MLRITIDFIKQTARPTEREALRRGSHAWTNMTETPSRRAKTDWLARTLSRVWRTAGVIRSRFVRHFYGMSGEMVQIRTSRLENLGKFSQ